MTTTLYSPFREIESILHSCRSLVTISDICSIQTTLASTLPDMRRPIVDEGHRDKAIARIVTGLMILSKVVQQVYSFDKRILTSITLRMVPGDGVSGPCSIKINTDDVTVFYNPVNISKLLDERYATVYCYLLGLRRTKTPTIHTALNIVPGNGTAGIGSIWMPVPLSDIPKESKECIQTYTNNIDKLVRMSGVYIECNYCGNGSCGAGAILCA
jgi:hypothetical protein